MRKPLIAITVDAHPDPSNARTGGSLTLNWNYADVVAQSGGVPVLVPPMADPCEIAATVHGWLIPGGRDIDAGWFGEENHAEVQPIEAERFEGERALFAVVEPTMPVLGVCYGCQFLNVVRGGSLVQHLDDVLGHGGHSSGELQEYRLEAGSRLESAMSQVVEGKSFHHQAVGRLGADLRVVGRHADGTVEAIELVDRPWIVGVQWHPERTFEDPATRRLFDAFIAQAALYRERTSA